MTNKYRKIYSQIIRRAKMKSRCKGDIYYESHHIVPKSIGGSDKSHNLVLLTAREHFIAHACLVKFTSGNRKIKMLHAFNFMCSTTNKQNRYINSYIYKKLKEERSIAMKGKGNPFFGKQHTKESMEKRSIMMKEKRAMGLYKTPKGRETSSHKDYIDLEWLQNKLTEGCTISEISKEFKLDYEKLRYRINKYKLTYPNKRKTVDTMDDIKIMKMLETNSIRNTAKHFGCDSSIVKKIKEINEII